MSFLRFPRWFVVTAVLLCSTLSFSQNAGQHFGSIDKFLTNLPPGYTTLEGSAMQIDALQLCCGGKIPTALFFNRSAPYVAFKVGALESSIPAFRQLPIVQLRADEAVVIIGVTPPEAKYFSYQPYLLTRLYPPETMPKPVFASLGDTVNVSTLNTVGSSPFNRPLILIITPDQGTEGRVRAALRNAGYPEAIMNTIKLPAKMLNFGLDPSHDDTFLLLHRMAMFTDPNAEQAYIDGMQSPDLNKRSLRVFRITPPPGGALSPFAAPPLRVRGTGRSEMDLSPALARLRQAIIDTYKDQYNFTEYHSRFAALDGNEYIQREKNTLGDNRDSLYMVAGYLPFWDMEENLTMGPNDFLVAYGPRHVSTGKATYTNINVYASERVMISLASVYSDKLDGSAYEYLGQDDPAADLMYSYKFVRSGACSSSFCKTLDVPDGCTPWCDTKPCPEFRLESDTKLGLFFRNYLEPATRVGPAPTELLYDQVIKFSPK